MFCVVVFGVHYIYRVVVLLIPIAVVIILMTVIIQSSECKKKNIYMIYIAYIIKPVKDFPSSALNLIVKYGSQLSWMPATSEAGRDR